MALLAVLVPLAVRLVFDPWLSDHLPFLLPGLAVVAVAWHGGFGPSIVTLVLGLVLSAYFIMTPRYSLAESLATHQLQVMGFLFLGVTTGLFSERLRAARRKAEALAEEAVRRGRDLEAEVARRRFLEHELLERAQELSEADRRKDEFLAMLGHELRNPLASIVNAVQVMQILDPEAPDLRRARDLIDRQAKHLSRLVEDLLDVSRISRGKILLKKEPVELAGVIEHALESSRPLMEARRHELSVELPSREVRLLADPVRLAQVTANLLNNAAKYTDPGGQVRLTAEQHGEEVVVRVTDNGVGIAAEMLPKVFDLFAQAHQTLDRSGGGLGLGLTLVKRLVELHGGSVAAFSAGPGKGSEFVVRLPCLSSRPGWRADGVAPLLLPHTDGVNPPVA
jgi:signal transduction histidine kinase